MKTKKKWQLADKQFKYVDVLIALGFKEVVLGENYRIKQFIYMWPHHTKVDRISIILDNRTTAKSLLYELLNQTRAIGYNEANDKLQSAVSTFREFLRL